MPILRGGGVFGEALSYPTNPIRMSYYRGGERLPQPICHQKPNPEDMVDEKGRMIEDLCREYGLESPPYYEAQALVIKTEAPDQIPAVLPNAPKDTMTYVVAQFWVHIGIWIHGMGTDDGERGRDVPEFRGRLSPFAEREPDPPYYAILNPALRR